MASLDDTLQIQALFDIYGAMLSDRKRDVIDLYYNEDLSLSEVAENINISRQGVSELLARAKEELLLLESNLHLMEQRRRASDSLSRLEALAKASLDAENGSAVLEELALLRSTVLP